MAKHPPSESFDGLKWHRIKAVFINVRLSGRVEEHPISIINAIVKGVTSRLDGSFDNDNPHVIFHITERRFNRPKCALRQGDKIPVDVLIVRKDAQYAQRWADALAAYLADPHTEKNYEIANINSPDERCYETLASEAPTLRSEGEICIEFLSPLAFGKKKGRDRTFLNKEDFVNAIASRFLKLFCRDFISPDAKGFSVLPYYWQYNEIPHSAKSQPGVQYINGCAGRLYIKGDFAGLLPFLVLGSELHAGGRFQNSQGYYVLREDSPPHFAESFPEKRGVLAAVRDMIERHDNALASLAAEEGADFDEETFAEKLFNALASGSYEPAPSVAFTVKKKDGSDRLIEQPSFRDLIVQRYLFKTVSETFDRMFEESSIGYRKGVSRKAAIDYVRSAATDGYEYVIESDVEGFFPSVDRALLEKRLDELLPAKDRLIKELLLRAVSSGYVLNGEYRPRLKGLPQGNPLSPLLANLYLDRFDERMKAIGARLVRYADDFIIMAKTMDEAEGLLARCEEELSGLGLAVNRGKTGIRRLKEGFEFLGITFAGGEAKVESEEEFSRRLKKPLYVTEPYSFLSLSDDALEVRKNGRMQGVVPLRRISEIMVMEKTVFSTALIKRCAELKIPFTITMNTGYYITTIRPDSKSHYDITYRHTLKFASAPENAHLMFAKEFAAGKIANYAALFRQRHEKDAGGFAAELDAASGAVHAACGVNEVRGIEGAAARKIYQRLNDFIDNGSFCMKKREREKPDRINSLLNFGYYLLFSRINATVRATGLNPYLGFLHSHADNYESLVCDIQELFRARIDRLVVRLVGLGTVTEADFTESDKGFYLTRDGVKKFIDQFEAEMERKGARNVLSMKEAIYAQVLSIRRWALDEGTLSFYEWKP